MNNKTMKILGLVLILMGIACVLIPVENKGPHLAIAVIVFMSSISFGIYFLVRSKHRTFHIEVQKVVSEK